MSTPITMPEAGESVVSGVLSAWIKNDGDWCERDDIVAEVETDKITVEVLAPASGVLKQTVEEGADIEIGATIGEIDESAEKPAGASAGSQAAPGAQAEGAGNADNAAPAAPAVATAAPPQNPPTPAASPSSNGASNGEIRATPLARKIAEQHGVDLGSINGTGVGDRISEHDVLHALESAGSAAAAAGAALAGSAGSRETSLERMSPIRQKIASRLVEAQQTAAMLTTFNEVDMGPVMELRKQYKEQFTEKHGVGLGFMSFFVKAVCGALNKFPMINAYITADADGKPAIQKHNYCDIAIAVASPKGLVVPVIRSAETLSYAGIESTIKDFGARAKAGKIGLEEMQGGTFTITNGGVFGSLMSTPILNPPQSAILGMHTIKKRPAEDPNNPGQIALRPMMYLALSYDHRIVDGAEAVQFLVSIKDSIEDPRRLLLDL
ncbi:MAG: 2-oxoglutarate dehydrogenase complex dihydrolipoyllysine-residue succinyltransferase [Phycisphaerales bacterium JB059]